MKKRLSFALTILVISGFVLTACGGPSIDTIKQKYKNEGYYVSSLSNDQLNTVAGAVEGFDAEIGTRGNYNSMYVNVKVYKFSKGEFAEEFKNRQSEDYVVSLKNKVYLCRIESYRTYEPGSGKAGEFITDSAEVLLALDIFNSCF